MKLKLLTDKEREEMDREIVEQEAQEKEKEASPKQPVAALKPTLRKAEAFRPRISDLIPSKG